MIGWSVRWGALVLLVPLFTALPEARADDPSKLTKQLDQRVGKLESDFRVIQRKVFPNGTKFLEPEFPTPTTDGTTTLPAKQDGTAEELAALQGRVQDLEHQLGDLTGRLEQNESKIRALADAFAKFQADVEFRLNSAANTHPAPISNDHIDGGPPSPPEKSRVLPVRPSIAPEANLSAETSYKAAYATYLAKDWDQAEVAFKDFLGRFPTHPLASNAELWLGRSYMSKKLYGQAARAFLQGYQKYPTGEKAPDSLLGLGEALLALDKHTEACAAFNEFLRTYPSADATLNTKLRSLRTRSKCK